MTENREESSHTKRLYWQKRAAFGKLANCMRDLTTLVCSASAVALPWFRVHSIVLNDPGLLLSGRSPYEHRQLVTHCTFRFFNPMWRHGCSLVAERCIRWFATGIGHGVSVSVPSAVWLGVVNMVSQPRRLCTANDSPIHGNDFTWW